MSKKKKPKIEYRHYQMPVGTPILALLGEKWRQIYGRDIDYLHFHNFLEIGYCYDGTGIMTLGENDFGFEGGCFTVIPPNYPHTTTSDPDVAGQWEYLFIDTEGFLHEHYQDRRREMGEWMTEKIYSRAVIRKSEDFPEIAGMIRRILDIMRGREAYYIEEAKGILFALFVNIARKNMEENEDTSRLESRAALPVELAMEYIARHYMEPMKIADLADFCHISEAHLRRLFSSYMTMSPLEYVNQVRIRMACEYLRTTDEPVADIAHKCGFPVLSTFNRNFREILGVSPIEWRKRHENYEQQILKFEVHTEKGW